MTWTCDRCGRTNHEAVCGRCGRPTHGAGDNACTWRTIDNDDPHGEAWLTQECRHGLTRFAAAHS
jgi:hypothetical protein